MTGTTPGAADGLIAVCGSEGYGQGGDDVWLMKLKADGSHTWSRAYGRAEDDDPLAFLQTADGGFLVTGQTLGFAAGKTDLFLLRTDAEGNPLWFQRYGGAGKEEPTAIVASGTGFLVTGYTSGGDGVDSDAFVLRVDAAGQTEHARTWGGPLNDIALAIAVDAAGGFVLAGRTGSGSQGVADAWLVKARPEATPSCKDTVMASPWKAKLFSVATEDFVPEMLQAGTAMVAKPVGVTVLAEGGVTKAAVVCGCGVP